MAQASSVGHSWVRIRDLLRLGCRLQQGSDFHQCLRVRAATAPSTPESNWRNSGGGSVLFVGLDRDYGVGIGDSGVSGVQRQWPRGNAIGDIQRSPARPIQEIGASAMLQKIMNHIGIFGLNGVVKS